MVMYDVYYRKKGDKNAEEKMLAITSYDRQSCKLIALSQIGSTYTITKMIKVG